MTVWLVTDTSLGSDASYESKAYTNFEDAMDEAYNWARDKEWGEVNLNRINHNWYFLTGDGEMSGAIDIVKKMILGPPKPILNTGGE